MGNFDTRLADIQRRIGSSSHGVGHDHGQPYTHVNGYDVNWLVDQARQLAELRGLVEEFVNQRPEFVTAMRNTPGDQNQADYWRWSGHAEARRTFAAALGVRAPHDVGEKAVLSEMVRHG